MATSFFEAQDRLRGGPDGDLCADGYTFHLAGFPPMDLAVRRGAAGFYGAVSDLRHQIEDAIAEGDRATVQFRLVGTNDGPFMDNPASGKSIDVGALVLMRVEDGRVAEIKGEFDQLGLMQQIGAIPAA